MFHAWRGLFTCERQVDCRNTGYGAPEKIELDQLCRNLERGILTVMESSDEKWATPARCDEL